MSRGPFAVVALALASLSFAPSYQDLEPFSPPGVTMVLGSSGGGSGFVVSCEEDGLGFRVLVLTARHVVDGESSYQILLNGELVNGFLVDVHPTEDVALLSAYVSTRVEVPDLAPIAPEPGTVLLLSGFPALRGPYLRDGVAGGLGSSSCSAYPGDSGGAVSLRDGTIIGVLVSGEVDGYQMINFATHYVPLISVWDWLMEGIEDAQPTG